MNFIFPFMKTKYEIYRDNRERTIYSLAWNHGNCPVLKNIFITKKLGLPKPFPRFQALPNFFEERKLDKKILTKLSGNIFRKKNCIFPLIFFPQISNFFGEV